MLPKIKSEVVDSVFADPPFNLGKEYGKRTNDLRPDYLDWCRAWLDECIRVLKPGGAIFVYNLPKWNVSIGASHGARPRIPTLDCSRDKRLLTDPRQIAPKPLQLALLHERQAEDVSANPNANCDVSALRGRG